MTQDWARKARAVKAANLIRRKPTQKIHIASLDHRYTFCGLRVFRSEFGQIDRPVLKTSPDLCKVCVASLRWFGAKYLTEIDQEPAGGK